MLDGFIHTWLSLLTLTLKALANHGLAWSTYYICTVYIYIYHITMVVVGHVVLK